MSSWRLLVPTIACALPAAAQAEDAQRDLFLFPHAADGDHWVSGQANVIAQGHPRFPAAYTGQQSLKPQPEGAVSFVGTLFTGYRLTPLTEAYVDVEMAAGGGISQTFGLGGFTNLDVVRNPTLGSEPYLARVVLRQIIPLGAASVAVGRGPHQVAAQLPARRLELAVGKLSTADYFDRNSAGSDSHLQFMNWTVDNNGAYDYAADTRGYTYGAVVTYESPRFAARFGEMLMPKVANGIAFDWDIAHSRAENLEAELRFAVAGQPGVVRGLFFLNHANMGLYRAAIDSFRQDPALDAACRQSFMDQQMRALPGPVIECHRREGTTKAGVGINFEQALGPARLFGRAGWSDGRKESFAYTEVDRSVELGGDLSGNWWRRADDRLGVAGVANGLAAPHRDYLALGGKGFLLGDGALRYGPETIVEGYYTALVGRGLSLAVDAQWIRHPGYNRDRGPAAVGAVRLHLEL
jgi:high affinity Mn2+ porin